MRDFYDLIDASDAERHVFVELRPSKLVTAWALHSGDTWAAPFGPYTYADIVRDVVAVRTIEEPALVRAHTLALCLSTPGTYCYDPDQTPDGRSWDDGVAWWDAGAPQSWDTTPLLYVHLTDGADPRLTSVSACLGFYVGSKAAVHPDLAPDLSPSMVADPGLQDWASASDLTNWTESASAGCTVARESTIVRRGVYSARLQAVAATNPQVYVEQSVANVVQGKQYRVMVEYRTEPGNQVPLFLRFGIGGAYVTSDGRSTDASDGIQMPDTGGEWRRAIVDVLAWSSGTFSVRAQGKASGSGLAGTIYLDQVDVKRIWRFNLYEPRLAADFGLSVSSGAQDIYFGGKTTSSGSITILNGDAALDPALGDLDWINCEVRAFLGGAFSDGQEVLFDDCRQIFSGFGTDVSAADGSLSLSLRDARDALLQEIPSARFDKQRQPNLDPKMDGKPVPLLLGTRPNVPLTQIALASDLGITANSAVGGGFVPDRPLYFGIYQLVDETFWVDASQPIQRTAVWAYADQASADKQDTAKRSLVRDGFGVFADACLYDVPGRPLLGLYSDPGPFIIESGKNDWLDFVSNGVTYAIQIPAGGYTLNGLQARINSIAFGLGLTGFGVQFESQSAGGYDGGSKLIDFTSVDPAPFTLLIGTGVHRKTSAWQLLGFTGSDNLTGAKYYKADTIVIHQKPEDIILRADCSGYLDDSVGTYTGTPNAAIELAPDIVRFIWSRILRRDARLVDTVGFVAGRTDAPQKLGAYLDAATSVKEILETVERSVGADVTLDGAGVLRFNVQSAADPVARQLYDRDYISFGVGQSTTDVYARVILEYVTGGLPGAASQDTGYVQTRFGRDQTITLSTYLTAIADVQARLADVVALGAAAPKVVECQTRSALADLYIGQKVALTRSRTSLISGGALAGDLFRILTLKLDPLTGITTATLVEDVAIP